MRLHQRSARAEMAKMAKRKGGASPRKKKRLILDDAGGDTVAEDPTSSGEGMRLPNLPTNTQKSWVIGSGRHATFLISVTDPQCNLRVSGREERLRRVSRESLRPSRRALS